MDDDLEGEFIEMEPDEESEIVDTDDGGAIVKLDETPKAGDSKHLANLAEDMDLTKLNKLATQYAELLSRDKQARARRDEQYEEGIRRTGLGNDAPGGAAFEGASKVVHPMLTEACVDFSSRAIKELFPASGPAKSQIVAGLSKERAAKAQRKSDFMNWQLTVQAQEVRSELEQLLTQVPLGGVMYMKMTWNRGRNRPEFLFIAVDDMLLPYAATNFYTSSRKTHVQYLTAIEYAARVDSGMYVDVDMVAVGMDPEQTKAAEANDRIEGREATNYNEDGLRTIWEVYTILDIEDKVGPAPYILSIDKTSNKVLSIYRNWDEDDDTKEALEWVIEFPFVPWRGAYPIGLTHMIGGLSGAATGSLRALLDSAHIANSQTMLKLKSTIGGQSDTINPTQVMEIEGGLNVDDVRKVAMPLPFNPPSTVLFQLLGFLVDAGKGVVRTTMDDISDSNQNVPVGTTLAKIEQGQVVFSAIHARLHNAMGRLLRVQHRLNAMYLDDADEKKDIGDIIASRADFTGPMDVVPVSDPNIFSESQRFAQVQAVAQRSQLVPQLYNLRKVEERILATLKIPDPQELLAPNQNPTEDNAVVENVKATLGRPVVAFPKQDHVAHLKTHVAYMMNPSLGMSQLIAPHYLPVMIAHLKEHIAFWYADAVFEQAKTAFPDGMDLQEAMEELKTTEDKQAFDRMLAEASLNVVSGAQTAFQSLPPAIEDAMKLMQSLQPPMPADPATQAAMADVKMREKAAADKIEVEKAKLAADQQADQLQAQKDAQDAAQKAAEKAAEADHETQQEAARLENEAALAHLADAADAARESAHDQAAIEMNTQDNETAIQLAEMEIASKESIAKDQNHDQNQNPDQNQNQNPKP